MTATQSAAAVRCASALSISPSTNDAVTEVIQRASTALGGVADLAVVFVSHHHAPQLEAMLVQLREQLGPRHLIGCTGESIVGVGQEIELSPAISLWLAQLPGCDIRPLRIEFAPNREGGTFHVVPKNWSHALPDDATMLLLGEPYSFPADGWFERLSDELPRLPIIGGMASGAFQPRRNAVFQDDQALVTGAVGVCISGAVQIDSVVSQGCRPIGRPMIVTKAEGNVLQEVAGKPPLVQLREMYETLTPEEQQLIQQGLHVGVVIDEYQENFTRGSFLIRNCMGVDRSTGAMVVGDYLRRGQTVQFHIRDARSADEDLRELLGSKVDRAGAPPSGGLLFTCNGRGSRLFSEPHHDAAAIGALAGEIPLAGFFAQGEMGPIGGKNFLHGFTASTAFFRSKLPTSQGK